jgi:hypothetical protein
VVFVPLWFPASLRVFLVLATMMGVQFPSALNAEMCDVTVLHKSTHAVLHSSGMLNLLHPADSTASPSCSLRRSSHTPGEEDARQQHASVGAGSA